MVISARRIVLGMAVFILAAPPSTAAAAEIKALITIGVQSAIEDLAPKFEKANGHQITIVYRVSALLGKRVADGEPADLFIGTREGVDGLIKTGKIATGSDVAPLRTAIPMPELASAEPKSTYWYLQATPELLEAAADRLERRRTGHRIRSPAVSRLGPILQGFFTDRLVRQRQASPHTIAAYRDSLRLLITYAGERDRQAARRPGRHRPERRPDRGVPDPPGGRAGQQRGAPATPGWPRSGRCSATPRCTHPTMPR